MVTIKVQNGAAALVAVLIISVSALIMVTSSAFLSISGIDMAYMHSQRAEVLIVAEACVDDALRRIYLDGGFLAVDEMLVLGNGHCILNVSDSGPNKLIEVQGVVDNFYKKLSVEASFSGSQLQVNSWQELEN